MLNRNKKVEKRMPLVVVYLKIVTQQKRIIIQLEARLQPNIGFSFERALTVSVFTPKVNRFG